MTDQLEVLAELERRLVAACYPPARRRRRAWPWAAVGAVASCCAVVIALLVGSASVTPPAASALTAAAVAVARGPAQAPLHASQYWYTRTVLSNTSAVANRTDEDLAREAPPAPSLVWFVSRESMETWIGIDGTLRARTIELSRRFASPADRARWLASGQQLPTAAATDSISAGDGWFPPQLGAGASVGDGLFSYAQLLSLPTSLRALRTRLEQAEAAFQTRERTAFTQATHNLPSGVTSLSFELHSSARSPTQERAVADLETITELLSTPVPTAVRAALFRLAATIPAVTYAGRVRDPLGRPGVAVSVGAGAGRLRLIFDPRTGALLASIEGAALTGTNADSVGPTTTTVTQGVVDSIRALPASTPPISGPPGLHPETVTITPRVGRPATTFTLELPTRPASAVSRPGVPRAFIFSLSGPAGPRCEVRRPAR